MGTLIMWISIIAIIFIVVVSILCTRNLNRITMSFKESMDLTSLPVVTFKVGETKLNFLLDTGSNTSYINRKSYELLGEYAKEIKAFTNTVGVDGIKHKANLCTISFTYKDKKYTDIFGILDLDSAFDGIKNESGVQIHGILGSKFFEKYRYILDFSSLIAYIK